VTRVDEMEWPFEPAFAEVAQDAPPDRVFAGACPHERHGTRGEQALQAVGAHALSFVLPPTVYDEPSAIV
jgi:hypothetical protein